MQLHKNYIQQTGGELGEEQGHTQLYFFFYSSAHFISFSLSFLMIITSRYLYHWLPSSSDSRYNVMPFFNLSAKQWILTYFHVSTENVHIIRKWLLWASLWSLKSHIIEDTSNTGKFVCPNSTFFDPIFCNV